MAVVDENRYKSNSYKSKAEAEKKDAQKVVKGQTRIHQKTTAEKLKESFFGENIDNVGDYLLFDVLIPASKQLFDTFLTNAKDIILYGEVRESSGRGRNGQRGAYYDYTRSSRRNTPSAKRSRFDFSYIDFDSPDDIDSVIEEMRDIWSVYDYITVAHYYQSADPDGIKVAPTDWNWGWYDLRAFTMADIRKVRSRNPETGEMEIKWLLDLPRPKPLD